MSLQIKSKHIWFNITYRKIYLEIGRDTNKGMLYNNFLFNESDSYIWQKIPRTITNGLTKGLSKMVKYDHEFFLRRHLRRKIKYNVLVSFVLLWEKEHKTFVTIAKRI